MQTIIVTAENHAELLTRLSDMMDSDPEAGSEEATELQELAQAISDWEDKNVNLSATVADVAKPLVLESGENPTHILFYFDNYLGKNKEQTGDLGTLRAWAKKQHADGNIRANWDVEKL